MNIAKDFPIFDHHPGLVYLDSAATALKPRVVVDKVNEYYTQYSTNVHRGLYPLAEQASTEYEKARAIVGKFLNAKTNEIIFTRSASEAINLVAYSFARTMLKSGQAIVMTELEHHSNIVPWYLVSEEKNLKLVWWPVEDDGTLDLAILDEILKREKVSLVAITGMSNVTGTLPPLAAIIKKSHQVGAKVLIDAAQLAAHGMIDVQALDADFLVFSGHKIYGPTGIGVLYGKTELLSDMPPFEGGGEMIREVSKEEITFAEPPHRFEAGTPPIAEAIGLGAAIEYVTRLGLSRTLRHEEEVTQYALEKLKTIPGLKILGPNVRGPLVSLVVEGVHPHDLGTLLGEEGIAVRAGHHCAMPLHTALKVPGSTRASFGIYTTKEDIDKLAAALKRIQAKFSRARTR